MAERLNVYDDIILGEIERDYKSRIDSAYGKSVKATGALVDMIQEYREKSYEQICDKIKNIAKKTFLEIDDISAYKQAIAERFEKQYEDSIEYAKLSDEAKLEKINKEIDNLMKFSKIEDIKNAADIYRNSKYETFVDSECRNAYTLHGLFNLLDAQEAKDYMALFQDYKYNEELLDARINSIKTVAKKHNVKLPLCLDERTEIEAVEKSVRRVVQIEELNDEERSLKERVIAKAKYGINAIKENNDVAAKIAAFGFGVGAASFVGTLSASNNAGISALVFAISTPIVIGALTAGYRKICLKDDAESVDEAKRLGLFDRKVRAEQKKDAFLEYDKYLKEKYTELKIEGGNNGLHQ